MTVRQVPEHPSPGEMPPLRPPARRTIEDLAAQVAELEERVEHLTTALANRPRIEHAVGMIMLLMPCDADLGFQALRSVSQHTNRKVRDVAEEITNCAATGRPLPAELMDALTVVLPRRPTRATAASDEPS
ncbi:ANTAR domain-containing protein [Kineococcus sp. R8]|uniref:ANTAR domain-containing protein n=1 Tax=Kineococcus siccus TaxID=2696567 RepID=UPI001412AC8E|nr:ANTAR domain-containing protein [Kineococcus siccus]